MHMQATCTGISPLLMNPMSEEALNQLWSKISQRGIKADVTPKKAAEAKIIRDESGKVGIPDTYLLPALVGAGKFVKFDAKRSMSTGTSSLVPGLLQLCKAFFPFVNQDAEWKVDMRRGMGQKGAVVIVRPRFGEWSFIVDFEYDESEIDETRVRALFDKAGKMIGLGDFRPSCKGPFGRFIVSEWKQITATKR
jgi:hypothetical protein